MGFKRNVDKKSGPIMMQNSPLPKCESRNPRQTICEFRKIHRAGDYIPWMAANRLAGDFGPQPGRGNRNINYLCTGSNLTRPTQNHIQSELTNAITGTPYPSLPVGIFSHGRSG
jgi:hypothetical protein